MRLNSAGRKDGGLVIRRARKFYDCAGSGSAIEQHAPGCERVIGPGETYLECMWSAPAWQSGSRHTQTCAEDFFADWVIPKELDR